MKQLIAFMLFTCACIDIQAQVNFVKNPDFEQYTFCPNSFDQIQAAKYWNAVDTIFAHYDCRPEYCNVCSGLSVFCGVPSSGSYWQYPHSGRGMVEGQMFDDETIASSPPYYTNRDYLQGNLFGKLNSGKVYCVSFYVNLTEASQYAINKIGAYLDDGIIDTVEYCGKPITFVTPQVYASAIINDTANWVKIEGSFVANGTESFITIGNFFNKASTLTYTLTPSTPNSFSWYLIDDVSVIPMDLDVQAGEDTWVGLGATRKIGRIKDSATIQGLDCKWYHKGILIDSGGIITVHANAVKGAIDTYVVVQTICGLVKTDTVLVSTVGAGMSTFATTENTFSISPNPSSGKLIISDASLRGGTTKQSQQMFIKVYDLLGRVVYEQSLILNKVQTPLELNLAKGAYLIRLEDEAGNVQHERLIIE